MGVVSHDANKKKKKWMLTESWGGECTPLRGGYNTLCALAKMF